ncbi:MAG TPA: energy transducer TonB [Phenylobacterium sp.]|nr:energy transducer TonB [Phenylobacterium sp.]
MAQAAPSGWQSLPTKEELLASYPPAAIRDHFGGEAEMICGHDLAGALEKCRIAFETPAGVGFGAAALSLASKFRVDMNSPAARQSVLTIPLLFEAVGVPPPSREAVFPKAGQRVLAPAGPYWPEAALRMGVGGSAKIDCKVAANGRLNACRMVTESPIGFDFILAALKMAERGWMVAGPVPEGVAEPTDGYWRFEVAFPRRTLVDAR